MFTTLTLLDKYINMLTFADYQLTRRLTVQTVGNTEVDVYAIVWRHFKYKCQPMVVLQEMSSGSTDCIKFRPIHQVDDEIFHRIKCLELLVAEEKFKEINKVIAIYRLNSTNMFITHHGSEPLLFSMIVLSKQCNRLTDLPCCPHNHCVAMARKMHNSVS